MTTGMVGRGPRSYLKALSSISRINLLHELQVHGSQTIAELAAATGLHHNTAREHLHRLIASGLVVSEPIPRTTRGRPKALYSAAAQADSSARAARRRAAELRATRVRGLLPLRAAMSDVTPMDRQVAMLDDHMAQCGFDIVVDVEASKMTMHECPFSELVRAHPQVCEVHFALVQDALGLEDGPLTARALHPFSGPNDCTVDLAQGQLAPSPPTDT